MMNRNFRRHSILPGFGLAMGFTVFYLSLIVLIPLSAAFLKTFTMGWAHFWETVTGARAGVVPIEHRRFVGRCEHQQLAGPARRLGSRAL